MKKIILIIICCSSTSVFSSGSIMEFLAFIKPGFINELCTNKELPYYKIYKNSPNRCHQSMDKAFEYCISSDTFYIPKTVNSSKDMTIFGEKLTVCMGRHIKQSSLEK